MTRTWNFGLIIAIAATLSPAAAFPQDNPPSGDDLPQIPVEHTLLLELDARTLNGAEMRPGGQWLAYSADRQLFLLPLEDGTPSGAPVPLMSPVTSEPIRGTFPEWASETELIFKETPDGLPHGPLARLELEAGGTGVTRAPRRISLDEAYREFALSPSGDSIVYRSRPDRQIRIIPSLGGTARVVADTGRVLSSPGWSDDGYIYYMVQHRFGDPGSRLYRTLGADGPPELVRELEGSAHIDTEAGILIHPLCYNRWVDLCGETRVATLDGTDIGVIESFYSRVLGGRNGKPSRVVGMSRVA